ncbi:hypothetical protein N0V95_007117 [Ascochyta clinopodiicola]|nr:hypothetical protein N0V95_007117 [Ascochyta clinopodiicola]
MSYLSAQHDDPAPLISQTQLATLLSLPRELAQSVLSFITNFEPWTYSSIPESVDSTSIDEEPVLCTRDAMPFNMTRINRYVLGLSSESGWLILVLLRHPYCLHRSKHGGISYSVTQALRRANAHSEKTYWDRRRSSSYLQIRGESDAADFPNSNSTKSSKSSADDDNLGRPLIRTSLARYYACVQSEEEVYMDEKLDDRQIPASHNTNDVASPAAALVLYGPAPILKFTRLDLEGLASRSESMETTAQLHALLIAILLTLMQCRISLFEAIEQLERDTPIPSIESCEHKDFATSKMSPTPDRPRSLSGSTVADVQPHEESLSFSAVSTVYSSENVIKRVQWEGRDDEVVSPKRPKLSQYKQVSSGRVATLMDRFEKFHF